MRKRPPAHQRVGRGKVQHHVRFGMDSLVGARHLLEGVGEAGRRGHHQIRREAGRAAHGHRQHENQRKASTRGLFHAAIPFE
jgi:hypothetical protein